MVMPWNEMMAAAVLAFQGWLAVRVISLGGKQIALEATVAAQQKNCDERLKWIRDMDRKLSQISEDTATIRVALGESPHAD